VRAVDTASRALALADEYEFPRWSGSALVCRGRALVGRNEVDRGFREMHDGLGRLQDAGLLLAGSLFWSLLADAYLQVADWREGLRAAEQGLALCRDTTERLFESALHRLKADLLLVSAQVEHDTARRSASVDEAGASIEQALAIARRQGAHALERCARRSRMRVSAARAIQITG